MTKERISQNKILPPIPYSKYKANMKINIVATTDIGKVRENNEDAFIICPDLNRQEWQHDKTPSYIPLGEYGSLLVVADGMGGANAGEVASTLATTTIRDSLTPERISQCVASGDIPLLLRKCVSDADKAISLRMMEDPSTAGMGTTVVICWVTADTAYVAWCGDSRCYLYHPLRGLSPLTKDHSYVQELVDDGQITAQEALTHPDSNIITRGLGDFDSQSFPDVITHPLEPNDMLLLCSDGLSGYCTDSDIESVLRDNYRDINACNDQLIQLAMQAGGHDNICIVLASLIDDSQDAPASLTRHQKLRHGLKRLLNL